jgi:MFS family permease
MTGLKSDREGYALLLKSQKSSQRWVALALVSVIFLVTTGGTFSSLGVLLPQMISDRGWSWAQAGLGFTVLGLFTGLSSTIPAYTIKKVGIRLTYLLGGLTISAGFLILSFSNDLKIYLLGAALVGLGYSQTGAVPAIKVISSWFDKKRSFLIGLFFTCGALGSVIGPLVADVFLSKVGSWALYWVSIAALILCLTLITTVFVSERPDSPEDTETPEEKTLNEANNWEFREVLKTPQYYIIILAVTFTLFGTLTMNAWQVTHMQNLGVAATMAAAALSAHAVFNAISRILGGIIIDKIGAKVIFALGLLAGVIGMAALSVADTPALILIFAIGDGVSFGIVTFATSIILLEYYGDKNNPMILGFVNLITTAAMSGPLIAGAIADKIGGFKEVFIGISIMLLAVFILTLVMKKPVKTQTAATKT